MRTVKLYKAGSSLVAVIPKSYLKTLGWQPGDRISVILESLYKISFFKLPEGDNFLNPFLPKPSIKKECSHETDNLNTTG